MRRINVDQITDAIARLAQETNYFLGGDVCRILSKRKESESSDLAKDILSMAFPQLTRYPFISGCIM